MCSANEVANLAAKAARGAGAPPAQAAMFGQAALCHLVAARDFMVLIAALDALPEGPILDHPLLLFKRIEATQEADVIFHHTAFALLQSYIEAQPYLSEIKPQSDGQIEIRLNLHTPKRRVLLPRITLPSPLEKKLQLLAAKTLVPDTAASRLSGAGAGLTDND